MILLGAAALASCQPGRRYPAHSYPAVEAARELATLAGGAPYPPFYGEGEFHTTGGKPLRGVIRLALVDGRYRLELASQEGAALMAYAGDHGRRALSLDPATGARAMADTGLPVSPYLALLTAVSGRPPEFGRVAAAYREGDTRIAVTERPRMELTYDSGLRGVAFLPERSPGAGLYQPAGRGGGELRIALGPMAAGPVAPEAVFPLAGVTLHAQWRRVWQDMVFPPGFFTFEDDPL